jgi:hypothetical protein
MKRAWAAASAALLMNTILAGPAFGAVVVSTPAPTGPDTATLAAMQTQCDTLAAAHGTNWTGTRDDSSFVPTYVSGPTEVGTHSIADAVSGTLVGAGTFTPAHTDILGDPYRNGGSVNMFGIKEAIGGHYSASQYDFYGDFNTVYSYAFNCNMSMSVTSPIEGYYEVADDAPGESADAIKQNCVAFTALGPDASQPWWGTDHAFCHFVQTGGGTPEDVTEPDEAGTPIQESQTDNLLAHENYGEGFDTSETLLIGQVVVCISPSKTGTKLPGAWVKQNGYTGDKCTTTWYNGGAKVGVPNLNTGSNNWVTVPVV